MCEERSNHDFKYRHVHIITNEYYSQEGETETENPFDIDVMKEDIPDEPDKDGDDKGQDGKDDKNGLEVSSDEEDGDKEGEDKEEGLGQEKVCSK